MNAKNNDIVTTKLPLVGNENKKATLAITQESLRKTRERRRLLKIALPEKPEYWDDGLIA
jgi:hypothetical protein